MFERSKKNNIVQKYLTITLKELKGAQAVCICCLFGKQNGQKVKVKSKDYITKNFDYDLNRNLDEIRPKYKFDVSCQGSVQRQLLHF